MILAANTKPINPNAKVAALFVHPPKFTNQYKMLCLVFLEIIEHMFISRNFLKDG